MKKHIKVGMICTYIIGSDASDVVDNICYVLILGKREKYPSMTGVHVFYQTINKRAPALNWHFSSALRPVRTVTPGS